MGWKEGKEHENFLKKQRAPSERLDDWLTVHRSTTFVVFQLDAQNSYLFRYNTFIKILYKFVQQSLAMHFTTLAIFLRLSLP